MCIRQQNQSPLLVVLVENLGAAAIASLCVGWSCRYQTRNRVLLVLEDTLEAAQAESACSLHQARILPLVVLVEDLGAAAVASLSPSLPFPCQR